MARPVARTWLWIGALAALAAAEGASAQGVSVTQIDGSVELGADFRRERFTSPDSPERRFDRDRYEELLEIAASGFVLTPEFITYRLGGSIGLRQERSEASDAEVGDANALLFGYEALLNVLPTKLFSLTLFGNRFEDSVSQSFGTDTDSASETLGATLYFNNALFPSSLSGRRLRSVTLSRGITSETRRDETRQILELTGQRFSETTQARVRLRDEDVKDESIPPIGDYQVREGEATLGLRWGDYFEKHWRGSARYFQRRGNFDFRNLSATSSFRWDVTDTLLTQLEYDFSQFESRGQETTSHSGIFSINHQLYGSLWTSFRLLADQTERTLGSDLSYGGSLSFVYRKRMPWNSRITANLAGRYRIEDRDLQADLVIVTAENLAITDVTGNFLANRGADPSSVEVLVSAGGGQLDQGSDYALDVIGDQVSIEIVPGSSIQVGDVVFVNYTFESDPSGKVARYGLSYGIAWDFGWLDLSYQHDQGDERVLEGEEPTRPDRSERDSFRLELRGERWNLRGVARARYITDRSASVEYDEISLDQELTWQPRRNLRLALRLREGRRDFALPERETQFLQASAWLSWWMRRDRNLRLYGHYRQFDDSVAPDQRDLEVGARALLEFGWIEVTPLVSWTRRARGGAQATDLRVMLRIKRSF